MKYFVSAAVVLILSVSLYSSLQGDEVSIQVKEATLRSKPSQLGKKVTRIPYATRLKVVETKGSWIKVEYGDDKKVAWVHKNSTTTKRITLSTGGATTKVSDKEQAIAGKGYNEQVENEYRKEKKYNYPWVDRMEKSWNIPDNELQKFVEDGRLYPQELKEGAQ